MKAEKVLGADYDFTDEPLEISSVDGLRDAIDRVAIGHGDEFVRCEDRVADYKVYWNSKTDSVRVAAVCMQASYEVPMDELEVEE